MKKEAKRLANGSLLSQLTVLKPEAGKRLSGGSDTVRDGGDGGLVNLPGGGS